jgi:hypothetical protein
LGFPMPPALHHYRRWATTTDPLNALHKGRNSISNNDILRCQRNL